MTQVNAIQRLWGIFANSRYYGPQHVPIGTTLALPVHPTGWPVPTVTWYHRGVPLTPRRGHIAVVSRQGFSMLVVSDIDSSEAGKYEVVVENHVGATKLEFDVVVGCKLSRMSVYIG